MNKGNNLQRTAPANLNKTISKSSAEHMIEINTNNKNTIKDFIEAENEIRTTSAKISITYHPRKNKT